MTPDINDLHRSNRMSGQNRVPSISGTLDRLPFTAREIERWRVVTSEPSGCTLSEQQVAGTHVVKVEGPVDVFATGRLGHLLLAVITAGADSVLLDLSDARPMATGSLVGTVLRMNRLATGRGAQFMVISSAGTGSMIETSGVRELMSIVDSRAQADATMS